MNPVVERQRWLGAVALALAVPLPLTGVVTPVFVVPFAGAALLVLLARRPLRPFPAWAENLLAPLILVLVVMAGGLRFGVLRPVTQLAVAVAAVRLLGGGQPGRGRLASALLALVGVAGIASSTHVLLVPYLLGLLVLVIVAVGRLTMRREAAWRPARNAGPLWPPVRMVAATVVIAALFAAPLFFLLPRLRSPFAAAAMGGRPVSGFRDAIALHRIGDVKESNAVALEISFTSGREVQPDWLRLAGTTVQHYRGGVWAQSRLRQTRVDASHVVERRASRPGERLLRAVVTLEKPSESLFLPPGTVAVTLPPGVPVWEDPLGSLRLGRHWSGPVSYEVAFDPAAVVEPPPTDVDTRVPPGMDQVRDLARRVARGTGNDVAEALAVEVYLRSQYAYTTSTYAPVREDPVRWFLFRRRSGHCEFFASSMVIMLRTLGIPARLQAGYSGGEAMDDGTYVVRDRNAHAWVVAWVGGRWKSFDPTPAAGRPGLSRGAGAFSIREAWTRVQQVWDRWVLTFSLFDQLDFLRAAVAAVAGAAGNLVRGGLALAALGLASAGFFLARRRLRPVGAQRGPGGIGAALARTRELASSRGLELPPSATPRTVARRIAARWPAAAGEVRWLVAQHETARYAGGPAPDRRAVARAGRAIARAVSAGAVVGREGVRGPGAPPAAG